MSFPHDPIITDLPHNLEIRRWHVNDATSCAYHGNNIKVWNNMTDTFPHPYTLQEAERWIALNQDESRWMAAMPLNPEQDCLVKRVVPHYAITLGGVCIGGVGLKPFADVQRRTAEVGYWIGEEHWGKGYMTLLTKAFVDWTWNTFPTLMRLEAAVFSWNTRSGGVLKKVGFHLESIQLQSVFKNNTLIDREVWVLLRDLDANKTCRGSGKVT